MSAWSRKETHAYQAEVLHCTTLDHSRMTGERNEKMSFEAQKSTIGTLQ
jgi:hypothetical protein